MRPICIKDNLKMEHRESGIKALEFKERSLIQPYKLWSADLFVCNKCGYQILDHFGQKPFLEEFEPDFYKTLNQMRNRGDRIIEFY